MTDHSYLYQEIAESFRRRIATGELEPGERLPPVRTLAEQWKCTPGTAARAYTVLAEEGLVTAHRGSGTRVSPGPLPPQRKAWRQTALVNRAEQFLLEALAGGHTPVQASSALSLAIARWEESRRQEPTAPPTESADFQLHFAGSHDLALEIASQLLQERTPPMRLEVDYAGSLGGLMALARGSANLAGVHLWDEETDTYNIPFIRRLLPGRRIAIVHLAHRSLGLIVPAGNPRALGSLPALARSSLRLANRQAGSGTRVWLDARLRQAGIDPRSLAGYDRELSTHLAVAAAVAEGEADAGVGIAAAAVAYGLDFIALVREPYELVILGSVFELEPIAVLRELLRSTAFRQAVGALAGYDATGAGEIRWL